MYTEKEEYNNPIQGLGHRKRPSSQKNELGKLFIFIALTALFGFIFISNKTSLRHFTRSNYLISIVNDFKSRFDIVYQFKLGIPGNYLDKGRENIEIDPRATHVCVFVVDGESNFCNYAGATYALSDLKTAKDGSLQLNLTIPREAHQIILYFCRNFRDGEIKDSRRLNHSQICTNMKVIYFGRVRDQGSLIIDKPEYNYVRRVVTFDEKGRETDVFSPGEKIYAKLYDFSNNCPDGREITGEVGENIRGLSSLNTAVMSEKIKSADDYVVFKALKKGEAGFLYSDDMCCMDGVGKIVVK